MFKLNILCLNLCSLPLILSLDTTEKSLSLFYPYPNRHVGLGGTRGSENYSHYF